MTSAVRTTATVKPGGLIEVRSNELTEGAVVEVIILVDDSKPKSLGSRKFSHFLGAAKGGFSSVADVDDYIRQERNAWDD